jgi:hypothetical protein
VRVEEEKDAGYWIGYWLDYVGLGSGGAIETGRTIPPTLPDEKGWQYMFVADILLECLAYAGGYTIFIGRDGSARVMELSGNASGILPNTLEYSLSEDRSWYRDRAVVFGTSAGSWVDEEWVSGEFTVAAEFPEDSFGTTGRTVAVSSPHIQSLSAAMDLAEDLVNFFDENLTVNRYHIVGDPDIWLGDIISGGIVTSIETTVDDAGFRQWIATGERCGFVWGGGGHPYGQVMFAVLGELSVSDDVCPWFICDIPIGITLLNSIPAIKTPAAGSAISYELETSTDGENWTYIHSNEIGAGDYLGSESETFTDAFLPENTLLRVNVTQIGSETAGSDLTVAVRLKIGVVAEE